MAAAAPRGGCAGLKDRLFIRAEDTPGGGLTVVISVSPVRPADTARDIGASTPERAR